MSQCVSTLAFSRVAVLSYRSALSCFFFLLVCILVRAFRFVGEDVSSLYFLCGLESLLVNVYKCAADFLVVFSCPFERRGALACLLRCKGRSIV